MSNPCDKRPCNAAYAFGLFALLLALPQRAQAQSVADFYRGKNLNLIVGYSAGGGYDTYSRILARHLGKHIPGNPSIVVQNMPGAGSLKFANYLYNVAPKDGTTIGTFSRGMAMEPLIGGTNVQFDATKFTWLGSGTNETSVFVAWHTAPVKTWNDIVTKPFTVGGEGSGSDPDIYALLLKNAFGAKLKLISGYPGTAEIAIALERGEVDTRASWSWTSLKTLRPQWLAEKKVVLPVQLSLTKGADLQDVPLITEFADTERQRQMLQAGSEPAGDGAALCGAARPAAGARGGAAQGVRRRLGRSGVGRRDEGARPGGQSGERSRDRPVAGGALRHAEGRGGGDAEGDRGQLDQSRLTISTRPTGRSRSAAGATSCDGSIRGAGGRISSRAACTALMMFW